MWPLVSRPGVFKARSRARRIRRHTSDVRDGHSGLCGGDEMRPRSHLRQGDKIRMQIQSGRLLSASSLKKKKKKKKRFFFAHQLEGSGLRTRRECLCASPQLEDEPGRRRGEAARASLFSCAEGSEG